MPQFGFGSGSLFATPLTKYDGSAIANPTPVAIGVLQDVSIDFSSDLKELFGQNQFAVAVGRGKMKIAGKAKFAQINGAVWNSIFFGQTLTAAEFGDYIDTTGAVVPSTPYAITPTPPNSGVWAADLGVINGATGRAMQRVASAPATGQYSVAAGVYTFAAADTTIKMFINYQYTAVSTVKQNMTVNNVLMGYAPTFRADFQVSYNGMNQTLMLPSCISTKLTMATKQDDFTIPDFDFSAFQDATGRVAVIGTGE